MDQAATILIAVTDGVLADSLRFSLELEGFETRFCDESSLQPTMCSQSMHTGCVVLDQDVFGRMVENKDKELFAGQGVPVVLMVSHTTKRILARAEAAGVTGIVEKPMLGGILPNAIRKAMSVATGG